MKEASKQAPSFKVKDRWGAAIDDGFLAIPNILLKKQHELELSSGELVTLLNILAFWWKEDALPFPGLATLAKRMGLTTRSVERHLKELVHKQLVERVVIDGRNYYDPAGLVRKLNSYQGEIQHKRGAVARPN